MSLRNTEDNKECYTLRRRGGQIADPNQSRIISFGLFEVDPRAGELRKSGVKIKLQEQPFQILLTLLSRPGDIVTREELCKQLWAKDIFVDFDHSLNAAIKRLRDALGESAEAPVFIETLARRGYRFIAPVDMHTKARVERQPHVFPPARLVPTVNRSSVLALAAIVATALGVVVALNWIRIHDWASGASRNRIESLAVLPLDNLSHDPEQEYFTDGMTEELITNLSKIGAASHFPNLGDAVQGCTKVIATDRERIKG